MHKVVYNACFGGFSLSRKALEAIAKAKGKSLFYYEAKGGYTSTRHTHYLLVENPDPREDYLIYDEDMGSEFYSDDENSTFRSEHCYSPYVSIARHDPILVTIVETLGEEANGDSADLRIKEIKGDSYRIDEYDGSEYVITQEGEE